MMLTKAIRQKRVAVAQDVLLHYKEMHIKRDRWISDLDRDGKPIRVPDGVRDLQDICETLRKECQVCAMGAMLISYASRFDNVPISDFVDEDHYFSGAMDTQCITHLSGLFSVKELKTIEAAFEMTSMHAHYPISMNPVEVGDAVQFGYRYPDPHDRLAAIMTNIVENDGEFVP